MSSDEYDADDSAAADNPGGSLDDRPDWLREPGADEAGGTGNAYQFSIASLLWLMTVSGAYVYLEKAHAGRFGLHAVAVAGLIFGVGLPILWLILWGLHRLIEMGTWLGMLLLALTIAGLVVFSLTRFPGF